MSVTVRFFASLAERIGQQQVQLDAARVRTAGEAWQLAVPGQCLPPNTLIAVNMEYANAEQPLRDGDEVAFMPPVTGG